MSDRIACEHMFVLEKADLTRAIEEGLTISQLADRFGCSKTTVRHWMGKYGLKTPHPAKRLSSPSPSGGGK
jgi:transposase-like protein